MKSGYLIHVKDYKAEIVEFKTLQVYQMPDGTNKYFVHTEYGDDFYNEGDLKSSYSELEQECKDLNKALGGLNGRPKGIYRKTK